MLHNYKEVPPSIVFELCIKSWARVPHSDQPQSQSLKSHPHLEDGEVGRRSMVRVIGEADGGSFWSRLVRSSIKKVLNKALERSLGSKG